MRLVKNWKELWKSYSVLFSLANILQAISVSGLAVLGVINIYFAFQIVITLAILFGALGLIGRLIPQRSLIQVKDDLEADIKDDGVINGSNKQLH